MRTTGQRDRPRHIRRWIAIIGIGLALLLGAAFAVLRLELAGPELGSNVASILNKRMRGRIEIGSIEWPTSGLKKVLTGGWVPLTLRDVRVWDDCVLSADVARDADELRTGDPNEDCTPDDRPDPDPASKRKPMLLVSQWPMLPRAPPSTSALSPRRLFWPPGMASTKISSLFRLPTDHWTPLPQVSRLPAMNRKR